MIISARPAAAAATNLCSDPTLKSASVQSTLQVKIHGVDWPSLTSTTQVSVPESWRGTSDLFGDASQQGTALACFTPVNTYDYEAAPPDIAVQSAVDGQPALVNITDIVTMTDSPEAGQTWREGPWTVTKQSSGYDVTFHGQHLLADGTWTVTVEAPGLTILHPLPQPTTDDGQGDLTWSFPAPKQPAKQHHPAPQQVPRVSVSLPGPWQVHMNLASDLWPARWFTDATWTLGDGIVFDVVVLLLSWRLLRRKRRGNSETRSLLKSLTGKRRVLRLPEERLPWTVLAITCLSVIAYAGYPIDDYLWHTSYGAATWTTENTLLICACAAFFLSGLGVRRFLILMSGVALFGGVSIIGASDLSLAPVAYSGDNSADWGVYNLLILMIPLLLAMTFAFAGAAAWISRLWPFGAGRWDGLVRRRSDTWLTGKRRVAMLVVGALVASALFLGQSAGASYYYWLHSDLWRQGPGALTWVTLTLVNGAHWWIADGIQWALHYTILVGAFAVLRTMRADARGVFFGPYSSDRGDLWLMAALAGSFAIGTGGLYDGISLPIPFIVAFVLLITWGLTRRLSRLDAEATIENAPVGSDVHPPESLLGRYQNDILAASDHGSATAARGRRGSRPSAPADTDGGTSGERDLIPLKPPPRAGSGAEAGADHPAPQLKLPWRVNPGVIALALGPKGIWWDNGVAAVKAGMYLTIVPIAFDIYILWNSGSLSLVNYLFGLQDAVWSIANNLVGWLTGLFMFGALSVYLRGVRTPLKGAIFGLIAFAAFACDAWLRNALGVTPYPTFVVDGLLAVALFATTGLLLDLGTLRIHNDQKLIDNIYRLGSVRVAVTYATTLVIVGVSLWQAVYLTSQTAQQRAQNLSTAAQQLNQSAGSGNQ
jgi:uncharacterized membrane protein YidH (DUF202 family)